jgi:transposase
MKSPQFINSLYLDSPRRIEALGYLLMILMLLLSVAEFVVRRELENENKIIIGPGKKVENRPSLIAIYRVFFSVVTSTVTINGKMHRGLHKPLKDNVSTILNYLGIPENIYYRDFS